MAQVLPTRSRGGVLRLRKDGNTLCMPLPMPLRRELGWRKGDFVCAKVEGDMLKVVKIELERITEEAFKCQS